jgi:integrase
LLPRLEHFQQAAIYAQVLSGTRGLYVIHSLPDNRTQSAGIENVRQYLGHKSIASTGAYLRVNDQQASLAVQGVL